MKLKTFLMLLVAFCGLSLVCTKKAPKDYPLKPVSFTEVQIKDSFWLPRMETNRKVTIPFAFKKCEETGRIANFAKAGGLMPGKFEGLRYNDSDVFKIMEGAAYSLSLHRDVDLEDYMDDLILKIAAAQEEDGYLYTTRTIDPENPAPGAGEERWSNLGSRHEGEAFGDDYELPNATAYNESCAAIGNVFWNHRLFLLYGDAKYVDVLERTIYNGLLSGISLSGDLFFYPNPLESDGKYKFNQGEATRKPWFDCACCPGNFARFLPSFPGYV